MLVLQDTALTDWERVLSKVQLEAVFSRGIEDALAKLRRGRFAAVVLDCAKADVLEAAANIRDVEQWAPVFVIKGSEDPWNYYSLAPLGQIYIIDRDNEERLAIYLDRLLQITRS